MRARLVVPSGLRPCSGASFDCSTVRLCVRRQPGDVVKIVSRLLSTEGDDSSGRPVGERRSALSRQASSMGAVDDSDVAMQLARTISQSGPTLPNVATSSTPVSTTTIVNPSFMHKSLDDLSVRCTRGGGHGDKDLIWSRVSIIVCLMH